MSGRKYGLGRHRPDGEWVQASRLLTVAGLFFRKGDVIAFSKAVEKAERKGLRYGVRLEPQPDNPHDRQAIAVYGFAERSGLFKRKPGEWHIGFIPADLAAEITTELLSDGIPIAAELYSVFEGTDDFFDVKIIVLAPPGHGVKARSRRPRA